MIKELYKDIYKKVDSQITKFQNKLCGSYLNEGNQGMLASKNSKAMFEELLDKLDKKIDKDDLQAL